MAHEGKARIALLALSAALASCTSQATIDRAVSAEEKEFALGFARALCDGTIARYKHRFDPELWQISEPKFPQTRPYCPGENANARLMGYHFNTDLVGGGTVTQMVVITESTGKWTRTTIDTLTESGSTRIVSWNMNSTPEKPADVVEVEEWDSKVIYFQIGIPLFLLAMIGGVVWFYRRSKRRAAARSSAIE